MATRMPRLSETILDDQGRPQSVNVSIREKDGSAWSGTIYDANGTVITTNPSVTPPTSNNAGLLEIYTPHARWVQIKPDGATAWTMAQFDPDPQGMPLNLDDFAGPYTINTGVYSAVDAINRAIVVAQATGQKIHVGAGTYLIDSVVSVPSYVQIEGEGNTTIFKHADHSTQAIFQVLFLSVVGVRLSRFKVDGNYANNNRDSDGFGGAEISMHGTDCMISDVLIVNFNCYGFLLGGERWRAIRCRAEGVAPVSYAPEYTGTYLGTLVGLTTHLDLASIHGFITTPQSSSHGGYMEDCSAIGTRATGIYVAGTNFINVRPFVGNCHRGYHPDVNSGGSGSSGGPQMGFPVTSTAGTTAVDVAPSRVLVVSPQIGGTSGPAAHGIEIGAAYGLEILDPFIESASASGIAIFKGQVDQPCQFVKVIGGLIKSCSGYGISVDTASDLMVDGTDIVGCTTGVTVTGTANYLSFINMGWALNPTNWSMSATPTVFQSYGHRVEDGTAPPQRFEGTPTTTGTGGLGAQPIARASVAAAASAADTITTSFADVSGCSIPLPVGNWLVAGVLVAARDAGVNDAASVYQAKIVAGTATATIGLSTSLAQFGPINVSSTGSGTQAWPVTVTVAGTIKLQVKKTSGTGSSVVSQTNTTISAYYQGNS